MQQTAPKTLTQDMIWIQGGTFLMGSDRHYPEEAPARRVQVDGFWMDAHTITNAQFAAFVGATHYVTIAERALDPRLYPGAKPELLVPGSLVFHMTQTRVNLRDVTQWWSYVPGACWHHPEGPGSHLRGREQHPVVQVAYEDAASYAQWAGKDLPTEAEWEFASRGGREGAEFVWGDEFNPNGQWMANTWQGEFPWANSASDGFVGTAPVGSYPPNDYGLYDMAGNVWQWTSDWYATRDPAPSAKTCCIPHNPRGGTLQASFESSKIQIPRKIVKGGSFLCSPNFCRRYRPAARHAQMIDSGMSHVGFRCIRRG